MQYRSTNPEGKARGMSASILHTKLFKKHAAHEHASRLALDGRYKKSNKYLASSRTSSNLLLHQQSQWSQLTVSLRIASLAATGINKMPLSNKCCTNSGNEINCSRSV